MESQHKYTAGNFVCVFVLLAHDFIIFGEQQNRDSPFVRVSFVVKHCERERERERVVTTCQVREYVHPIGIAEEDEKCDFFV
jgi:hypothetical protein